MRAAPLLGWAGLALLSLLLAAVLETIGLSAGLLLGPMLAGIVLAARGVKLALPRRLFQAGQAVIGCLIASTLSGGIVETVVRDWPLFLLVTLATLAASSVLGYLLSRWGVLPGSTAIWGSMPGAASAMVVMADAFGADARLVAFMTYTRVVCVAGVASVLAAVLTGHGGSDWLANLATPVAPGPVVLTLLVALAGAVGGMALRLPAAALLGPLILGTALNLSGLVQLSLPGPVLALSYAVIGWRIGLAFTRETLALAARALPRVLLAIGALLLFSGALAWVLAKATGIDLVTAYLAVSPGGMDSVAIIATSVPVDRPFVMAMQALRFVAVLLAGPGLARLAARRLGAAT